MKQYTTIHWEKLLLLLIPPIFRKKTHYSWLNVLFKPLRSIYETTLYNMNHTGQVISLEKLLNEAFNPEKIYNPNYSTLEKQANGLIYIDETLKPTLQFVYLHDEYETDGFLSPKVYLHNEITSNQGSPLYLASREDYTEIHYANFRVFIPENLNIKGKVEVFDIDGDGDASEIERAQKLLEITNSLYFEPHEDPVKAIAGAIEVRTTKYHNLLNFYKLAGKTYESYAYEYSSSIVS